MQEPALGKRRTAAWPGLAALVAVSLLIALALVTWLVLDPLKYEIAGLIRQSSGAGIGAIAGAAATGLHPLQISVVLAAGGLGGLLCFLEWKTEAISTILRQAGRPADLLFVAALCWLGHSYLMPGHLLMGDLGNHIALASARIDAVLAGQSAYWTNFQALGQPLSSFYAPTTFWPITWIGLAVQDPTLATKLFLFGTHVASGLTAFALARTLWGSRTAAFVTGLGYAGSFAHLHLILYRGTVPQALSVAVLPLALLFLHRVLVGRGHITPAWLGLILAAGLLLANYLPFGVAAGLFLGLYALAFLATGGAAWRRLGPLVSAGLAACALAGFVLVPALLASSGNDKLSGERLLYFGLPSVSYLDHLLMWRAWRTNFGHDSSAYLGLVLVVLAVFGVWSALRNRVYVGLRRPAVILAGLLVLSLFLRGDYLRIAVFSLFFAATLAGLGAAVLLRQLGHRRWVPAIVIGLLLLDLGSTSIQPLGRADLGAIDQAARYLAAQRPPTRTLEGGVKAGRFVAMRGEGAGVLQLYPAEFVVGGYSQLAGPASVYGELAGRLVESDLAEQGALQEDTRTLLCLLRVSRIVAVDRTTMGMPTAIRGTEPEGPLGLVLRPACSYQVVFAPALAAIGDRGLTPILPDEAEAPAFSETLRQPRAVLKRIATAMELDAGAGLAARIPVRALAGSVESPAPIGQPPTVDQYDVTLDTVRVSLSSANPGFVRLSHAWYPNLQATINGETVAILPDAMGFVVVPISAGLSRIELQPGREPGAAAGWGVSAAATLLLLAALGVKLWRRRVPAASSQTSRPGQRLRLRRAP